jgi:methylmalonyl-CoA/ethylmalonyl-CoA epimerase
LAKVARLLTKIHHVGIAVRSADDALGIFRDILGLTPTKDAVLEEQGVRGVLLAAGETEIELLEPIRPDSPVGRFLESRGPGLHHICFESTDIAADLKDARSKSLPLVDQMPRPGLAGSIAFLHPKATRGVLVEYAQPPAKPSSFSERTHPDGGCAPVFRYVTIATSDLDAMTQALRDNFGLGANASGKTHHAAAASAEIPIGHSAIEVISPLNESSPLADYIRQIGEGLYLLALQVDALDKVADALRDAGIFVTDPTESKRLGTRTVRLSPADATGSLVQLIEQPQ